MGRRRTRTRPPAYQAAPPSEGPPRSRAANVFLLTAFGFVCLIYMVAGRSPEPPRPSPGLTTTYASLPAVPADPNPAPATPRDPPASQPASSKPARSLFAELPVDPADQVSRPGSRATSAVEPRRLYVSGREVPLRGVPDHKGKILDRYETGAIMTELERRGDWIRVRHDPTQREGWVQTRRLRDQPLEGPAKAQEPRTSPALSTAAIAKLLIADSIANYSGSCACPYQSARNGSSCGRRSAYSRPGGAAPLCYASDVTPDMVAAYRANH